MYCRILAIAAVAVLASLLAGCRDSEQGRRTSEDKGTYSGQRLDPLGEERLKELRERAERQKG